ncbi:MAG: polysaccharide deacetylase family protein [Firmicutes bacterium]|nr:polysaccharide deacetylase family protein [Bacillota bacterium]
MKSKSFKLLAAVVSGVLIGVFLFSIQVRHQPSTSAGSSLKWVDFDVTYEALKKAMELDIETYEQEIHASWIDSLAYLGAKYGGDFSQYREADLDQFMENLKKGQELEDFTKNMKYFPYYQKAYGTVLGGMLGYYKIEIPNEKGEGTHWVEQYGLKAYSPLAEGYWYTDFDDFGQNRSYGYSRQHFGHDMMAGTGTPVIAVEGGIIEALGWNQYGGWRLGIRSFDKNRYYYYAHLRKDHPYAENLYVGKTVTAGQVIGYVGQTGYSLKENTNNINVPHLHYGMQLVLDEKAKDSPNQIWIDLYAITKLLSNHQSTVVKKGDEYTRKYGYSEESYYLAAVKEKRKAPVKLPVLMYHSLLKDPSMHNNYVIGPKQFESDLKYLKEHGYHTILMADLIAFVENGTPLPENPVLLTFDDGYYNNYCYGFPLLKKYNMKAVISIIGKETDRYSRLNEEHAAYSNLTWEHVRTLTESGLVEIQNHSYSSHSTDKGRNGTAQLSGESDKAYARYLEQDLMTLQKKIKETTGAAPTTFTYPFGAVSNTGRTIIKKLGFKASLGCEEGINTIKVGDPDCLYDIKRYLRTPEKSSAELFRKIESDMKK